MNAWIILLFLLMGNNGRGSCQGQNSCSNNNNNSCSNNNNNDCGCNSSMNNGNNNDCGCDDLKFEPRFEARPFRDNRETCGCEEKED